MKSGKIHFFFPSAKADDSCQTPIIYNYLGKKEKIYDKLHDKSESALLFQDPYPSSTVQLSYMQDFNSRLAFFISNANDDRFEKLTPPPDLFHEIRVGFTVDFFDHQFVIKCPDSKMTTSCPYENAIVPVIESLESGVVNRELAIILDSINTQSWEDGRILCKITDFRFPDPIEYNRLLTVSYSAVSPLDFFKKRPVSASQIIESEKNILLLLHPQICTDISPDVARAASIMDWRQKLWMSNKKIDPKESEPYEQRRLKPLETGNIVLHKLTESIKIPEAIIRQFASLKE